jgi:hypothetical protein
MSFFDKFKENTSKAAQQMGLATRIAKLKVEIATQKSEKERHLKTIGEKTYGIFARDKKLEGSSVETEIANELSLIERIDVHIGELHEQIAEMQAEFRSAEKDTGVVDATEVKEAKDSESDDSDE